MMDKKKIFTIPNFMSFFRLCLVPFIVYLYVSEEAYVFATVLIILSGITDVADGIVARKFNMTSDLGKILDPLADKITQLAMIVCVISIHPEVKILLVVFVIKEISQLFVMSAITRIKSSVESSHWFGKLCTVTLYISFMVMFVLPTLPRGIVIVFVSVCSCLLCGSLIGYIATLIKYSKECRNN